MQIKISMSYHFTPIRMAIIQKVRNNKCWLRCGEKGTLLYCWWECNLVQSLWKTVWRVLKKLIRQLSYDPGIQLLGIYSKNLKTLTQKDICTAIFIEALFTIAKIQKQPKCPSTNEWIKKMWGVCV